ncbi:MAG: Rrf2 family transcriptional regulator [Alphaproteobacteria bacterium]|nr:Rrf2 family transcriptional regulator [Alphaproteobacteria bacterium]
MLSLPRKTVLALEAVLDIAYGVRAEPVQAKRLTGRQGLGNRYLESAMQKLVRQGILKGVRGPRGGYRLARERRRISVGDIVRALAEHEAEATTAMASPLGQAVVEPLNRAIHDAAMRQLDALSLEELCEQARAAGVSGEREDGGDFVI